MRIVGGRHKGRRLAAPTGRAVRPTTDRVREALFNVLGHAGWGAGGGDAVRDAVVLDAFCGTGALALEALSRGAGRATLMDRSDAALAVARRNVAALGETARTVLLRADATRPPPAHAPASLCFLDPPYGIGLAAAALAALAASNWLAEGCVCAVELARTDDPAPPPGFTPLDERRYGDSKIVFLRRRSDDG